MEQLRFKSHKFTCSIMPLQGLIRVDKNLETNLDGIKLFFFFFFLMYDGIKLKYMFHYKKKKNLNTCI
jgi:hypothetical protein